MRRNVSGQFVGAQMVSATDGSAFTGAVTCYVTGDAGTQAAGSVGSGACTHEGNGFHTYAPAQAETNYTHVAFTFTGSGAVPATLQIYPLAYDASGQVVAASVAGAVGSVTGNVGGNVVGSVGSVTGNVGGNVTGSVGSLGATAKSDVNAEVLDVLTTDTFAEPGAVPAATSTLKDKINWLFALARNKITQTATTTTLRNDADSGDVATSTTADDGTTATRGEWS